MLYEYQPAIQEVQKYLELCPSFYVLDTELFKIITRHLALVFLRVRPQILGLITYRSLVFVENPQKLCFSYS